CAESRKGRCISAVGPPVDRASVNRVIQAVGSTPHSAKRVPADLDKEALHDALWGVAIRADIERAVDKTVSARHWRKDRGIAEWLMGVRLPAIYQRFFGLQAGVSTPGYVGPPGGPY